MSTLPLTKSRKYGQQAARLLAEMALRRKWAAEDLGDRLQRRRAELKLTQEQVAERMEGVTLRAYQRWEAGESVPQDRNLHRVAEALQMSPGDLIVELVPANGMPEPNQLERIEQKLDEVLSLLARQQVDAVTKQVRGKAKTPPSRQRKRSSGR